MELLLTRPAVIALAVLGALLALCASVLGGTGRISAAHARRLNVAGYVAMGASMLLFAVAGLRAGP